MWQGLVVDRVITISVIKVQNTVITFLVKCNVESRFPITPREKSNPDSSTISIVETQLSRERQKLDRAKQAYLSGIDTEQEYKDNKAVISEEIDRLSAELDRLKAPEKAEEHQSDIRERCKTALDLLASDEATPQEKNAALKNLI